MKKILTTALITATICILGIMHVCADNTPHMYIDTTEIEFTEDTGIPFYSDNKRTMVPLRAVMEAFGVNVEWDDKTQSAILKKGNTTLTVKPQNTIITINDEKTIISDTAPVEINERIYLPIRAVAEAFGGYVLWNERLSSVFILSDKYIKLRDMFTYEGSLSKYSENTVVVSAVYNGDMSKSEFEKYFLELEDIKTLYKIIATDKQCLNSEYEISINFWYPSENDDTSDYLLATVSSFSYEVSVYNPFEKEGKINQLNQ